MAQDGRDGDGPDTGGPDADGMCVVVTGLDAAGTHGITAALRRLGVPAVERATSTRDASLFEVVVPEPYLAISLEVLDATTHEPQGDAPVAEVLADLDAAAVAARPRDAVSRDPRSMAGIALFALLLLAAVGWLLRAWR